MKSILDKIKKVHPLVRAKKSMMDEQIVILNGIKEEKIKIVTEMKENQRQYMTGVDKINDIRNSNLRENIEVLERGLDMVKSKWYKLHLDAQNIENKERAQIAQVLGAQRELKKMEKLREQYEVKYHHEIAAAEQKEQDDRSIFKFTRNN